MRLLTSLTDICETPQLILGEEASTGCTPLPHTRLWLKRAGSCCCFAGSTTQGRIDQVAIFNLCSLQANVNPKRIEHQSDQQLRNFHLPPRMGKIQANWLRRACDTTLALAFVASASDKADTRPRRNESATWLNTFRLHGFCHF